VSIRIFFYRKFSSCLEENSNFLPRQHFWAALVRCVCRLSVCHGCIVAKR